MTRDEAKNMLDLARSGKLGDHRRIEMMKVIDSIYDDFESRTCENCKHFTKEFGVYGICQKGMTNHVVWHEGEQWKLIDFYSGCNKFERRRE